MAAKQIVFQEEARARIAMEWLACITAIRTDGRRGR